MKVSVFDLQGNKKQDLELPAVFAGEVNPDLIKRAVLAIESAGRQQYGAYLRAGRNNTAFYSSNRGKPAMHRIMNNDVSRTPRLKNSRYLLMGNVADVPQAVHGPHPHPAKSEKILEEYMNKHEKQKATRSAIASTSISALVKKRGHVFAAQELPVVVVDEFQGIVKTRQVKDVLGKLKVFTDVERAKDKRTVRAGKGKMRGRRYKRAKSILIVTGNTQTAVSRSARNLEGVDVVRVRDLNAKLLAPGAVPGRLTVWTVSAVKGLGAQ